MVRRHRQGSSVLVSWILILLWVAFIWGHSLIPGADSSLESGHVVELVRRLAGWMAANDFQPFMRLVEQHPRIAEILADTSQLSYFVRKGAHFTEYLILGMLSFNALRLTFQSPLVSLLFMAGVWVAVPNVDETIQRFVPDRSGQMSDVLLDMAGFGTGFALCLVFALVVTLLGMLFGGSRRLDRYED